MAELSREQRWRLVLGHEADGLGEDLDATGQGMDAALGFLYDPHGRGAGSGQGGTDGSGLMTTTDWLNQVHTLFPASVAERITEDAVSRYGLTDVVTDAAALATATPSVGLLKAILATKHLMNPEVLAMAREIVDTVVRQLMRSLARPVTNPFTGSRDRRRRSRHQVAANFDPRATVRANLRHVEQGPGRRRLVIREPIFNTRVRLHTDRWDVVVAVDQSGSMAESVIHAAVTASIFSSLRAMRTHLIAFDTEVADLSGEVGDPVELLMKVQLGGGTNIGRALAYARTLLHNPRRAILVLISDFAEGGSPALMHAMVKGMVGDGVTVLCLGALDASGRSVHDAEEAGRLAALGAEVAVMTPDQLAEWVAEVINR